MSDINPGDVVTVYTDPGFSLDDVDGTPADPSTVTLTWYPKGEPPTEWTWPPDGNITQTETGKFKANILVEKAVTHYFRWKGDGAVMAAEESSFDVSSDFDG